MSVLTAPTTAPAAAPPRLAAAFLALSDVDAAPPGELRPSPLAVAVALVLAMLLAVSGPLGTLSGRTRPSVLPLATQASKAALPAPDDDAAG
jgi:hypothetical protein